MHNYVHVVHTCMFLFNKNSKNVSHGHAYEVDTHMKLGFLVLKFNKNMLVCAQL